VKLAIFELFAFFQPDKSATLEVSVSHGILKMVSMSLSIRVKWTTMYHDFWLLRVLLQLIQNDTLMEELSGSCLIACTAALSIAFMVFISRKNRFSLWDFQVTICVYTCTSEVCLRACVAMCLCMYVYVQKRKG
jgi:hypothetical protein